MKRLATLPIYWLWWSFSLTFFPGYGAPGWASFTRAAVSYPLRRLRSALFVRRSAKA